MVDCRRNLAGKSGDGRRVRSRSPGPSAMVATAATHAADASGEDAADGNTISVVDAAADDALSDAPAIALSVAPVVALALPAGAVSAVPVVPPGRHPPSLPPPPPSRKAVGSKRPAAVALIYGSCRPSPHVPAAATSADALGDAVSDAPGEAPGNVMMDATNDATNNAVDVAAVGVSVSHDVRVSAAVPTHGVADGPPEDVVPVVAAMAEGNTGEGAAPFDTGMAEPDDVTMNATDGATDNAMDVDGRRRRVRSWRRLRCRRSRVRSWRRLRGVRRHTKRRHTGGSASDECDPPFWLVEALPVAIGQLGGAAARPRLAVAPTRRPSQRHTSARSPARQREVPCGSSETGVRYLWPGTRGLALRSVGEGEKLFSLRRSRDLRSANNFSPSPRWHALRENGELQKVGIVL